MNIPNSIIDAVECMPLNVRGEVYCAIINFMRTNADPEFPLSAEAMSFYRVVKALLVPVIERRRKAAEWRRRRRAALATASIRPEATKNASPTSESQIAPPQSKINTYDNSSTTANKSHNHRQTEKPFAGYREFRNFAIT